MNRLLFLPALLLTVTTVSAQVRTDLDNAQVRVRAVTTAPHAKTAVEDHPFNRVVVYFDAGAGVTTTADGKATPASWKAGESRWVPAGRYSTENTGRQPVRTIEVEIKTPASGKPLTWSARDPLKLDPKHYTLDFENNQVRVARVRFPAHEGAVPHEHTLNRVSIFLTDGRVRITEANGTASVAEPKVFTAAWGGAADHTELNLEDTLFEGVLVELKP